MEYTDVCSCCERDVWQPGFEFYERDKVCDKCWKDWELEKLELERDYYRSIL